MTMSSAANKGSATWRARGLDRWLALAAAPTLALMAGIAANDAPAALCASGSRLMPIDSMASMYLVMSLFHLSPWLKLVFDRPQTGA